MAKVYDPVGVLEIAERLGVGNVTVAQWKARGFLPSPKWTISGQDAWDWTALVDYLRKENNAAAKRLQKAAPVLRKTSP